MENVLKAIIAVGGGAASYFFGGWSSLLSALIAFVIIDYVTGFFASAIEGKLNSEIGLIGIAKKVFIFVLVAVANIIDVSIGEGNIIRDATIWFYLANEGLSILENAGRIGLPVPDVIKRAIEILKGKGNPSA